MTSLDCRIDMTGGGHTIMVVDDEPTVSMVAALLLERMGHRVFRAGSGIEALNIVSELDGAVTVALVDVTMPDMSGWETARRLQRLSPALHIVMTSGCDEQPSASEESSGCPVQGFLPKPYSRASLEEMLARLMFRGKTEQ